MSQLIVFASITVLLTVILHGPVYAVNVTPAGTPVLKSPGKQPPLPSEPPGVFAGFGQPAEGKLVEVVDVLVVEVEGADVVVDATVVVVVGATVVVVGATVVVVATVGNVIGSVEVVVGATVVDVVDVVEDVVVEDDDATSVVVVVPSVHTHTE